MYPLICQNNNNVNNVINQIDKHCFFEDIYRFGGDLKSLMRSYPFNFIMDLYKQGHIRVLNGYVYKTFDKKEKKVVIQEMVIGKPYKFKIGDKKNGKRKDGLVQV